MGELRPVMGGELAGAGGLVLTTGGKPLRSLDAGGVKKSTRLDHGLLRAMRLWMAPSFFNAADPYQGRSSISSRPA